MKIPKKMIGLMDISVNTNPGFFPAETVDQGTFHCADGNSGGKTKITASLYQIVVAVILLIQGNQWLLFQVLYTETVPFLEGMTWIDKGNHMAAEYKNRKKVTLRYRTNHKSGI